MSTPRRTKVQTPAAQRVAQSIFNEEDWETLKRLSGLPDNARTDVEGVVRFLREKPSLKHPFSTELQESRENIRKAIQSLNCASKDIDRLIQMGSHLVFHPLEAGPHNSATAVGSEHEIQNLRNSMERIRSDLEYSEQRLKYAPRGRIHEHLSVAVKQLNAIVSEATGRPLDQKKSNREGVNLSEFALRVCRTVQPKLGIKTILNLIKRSQASRRKRRGGGDKTRFLRSIGSK
jgi:hypothetical protein